MLEKKAIRRQRPKEKKQSILDDFKQSCHNCARGQELSVSPTLTRVSKHRHTHTCRHAHGHTHICVSLCERDSLHPTDGNLLKTFSKHFN